MRLACEQRGATQTARRIKPRLRSLGTGRLLRHPPSVTVDESDFANLGPQIRGKPSETTLRTRMRSVIEDPQLAKLAPAGSGRQLASRRSDGALRSPVSDQEPAQLRRKEWHRLQAPHHSHTIVPLVPHHADGLDGRGFLRTLADLPGLSDEAARDVYKRACCSDPGSGFGLLTKNPLPGGKWVGVKVLLFFFSFLLPDWRSR